jgi:hypothetical protein
MYKIDDHNPPHFHAVYGEYSAMFNFEGDILEGDFPPKQARFVKVWAQLRQEELNTDWFLARKGENPEPIDPLR